MYDCQGVKEVKVPVVNKLDTCLSWFDSFRSCVDVQALPAAIVPAANNLRPM